jgi:N-methylhydantoinase A
VWGARPELAPHAGEAPAGEPRQRRLHIGGRSVQAEVLRGEPAPGERVAGPALWELPESTLLVPPGWQGEVDERGTIHLTRSGEASEGA